MTTASELVGYLSDRKLTLAVAESVTAGLICSMIASVPGASAVLKGGVVAYDPAMKIKLLGVKPDTLQKHSAESAQVTAEMAQGLMAQIPEAEIHVAITGVASASVTSYRLIREVGQIYVELIYNRQNYSFQPIFKPSADRDSRNQVRDQAAYFVLDKIKEVCDQIK